MQAFKESLDSWSPSETPPVDILIKPANIPDFKQEIQDEANAGSPVVVPITPPSYSD